MKNLFTDRIVSNLGRVCLLSAAALFFVHFSFTDPMIRMVFWIGGGLSILLKGLTIVQRLQRRDNGPGTDLSAVILLAAIFLVDLVLCICAIYVSAPLWMSLVHGSIAATSLILLVLQVVRMIRGGNISLQTLSYVGIISLTILVFLVCLGVGFADSDYKIRVEDSGEESEITTVFTQSDHLKALEEIREDFDEKIYYKTTGLSELTTTDAGFSYYSITYLICTESKEDVTTYLYYKFATDSPDYKAGDLVCMVSGISADLTRSDVFPEGLS